MCSACSRRRARGSHITPQMHVHALVVAALTFHVPNLPRRNPHPAVRDGGLRALRMDAAVTTPTAAAPEPRLTPFRPRHMGQYSRGELRPARIGSHYALVNDEVVVRLGRAGAWDRARVGLYFALWYALSVVYSVKNKQAHMALALPNSIATAQLAVGAVVAGVLWLSRIRTPPQLSMASFKTLLPIGLFHGIGHLTGVYATAAGSVSFVQVVKSAGPVWACLLSGLLLREKVSRRVWLSLVPIVGGVGLASAQELRFVWAAFVASVASDVALALRNVLSKRSMDRPQAKNMTPANGFYLFTILSFLWCLPITLGLELSGAKAAWRVAAPSPEAAWRLVGLVTQGGLYFTAYSEVQFKALDQISPITHAVGNTMRRVVIMLVCIAVFGTPISVLGGAGSAVAIVGSYMYAMAKTVDAQKAKAAKAVAQDGDGSSSSSGGGGGGSGGSGDGSSGGGGGSGGTATAEPFEHPILPIMKVVGRLF